jgi:hypothetical protein
VCGEKKVGGLGLVETGGGFMRLYIGGSRPFFSFFSFFLFLFFTPGHLAEVAMVIGGWCLGVHHSLRGGHWCGYRHFD